MALIRYAQTSFTSGEFTPLLYGQTGLEQYGMASEELLNMVALQQGPADKRGGLEYLGDAKSNASGDTRLVEFVAAAGDALVIEITATESGGVRFWKDGELVETGGSPLELDSWISDNNELFEMQYAQEGNTIFFVHPNHYPRRLRRAADAEWELDEAPFIAPPVQEAIERPDRSLTLSATSGEAVTVTAAGGTFGDWLAGDEGRIIRHRAGIGVITAVTSATQVTLSVIAGFPSTSVPASEWELVGTPKAQLTFDEPSGDPIRGRAITLSTNPSTVDAFRASDVGRLIGISDGIMRITSVASNSVDGIIIETMGAKTATESWTLFSPTWEGAGSYPATVTIHQERLMFAGAGPDSPNRNRIFASRTGDFQRFDIGPDDNDALSFTLSGKGNTIRWMESARDLLIGTSGDERSVTAAGGGPITPSSIDARVRTRYGSALLRPALLGNEVIYVQRSRQVVRGMGFNFQQDTYVGDELSFVAEHITGKKVKQLALQEDPFPVAWFAMDSGILAGMTYLREQNVLGWHRQVTGYEDFQAVLESVATIPGVDGDEVWVAVRRQYGESTFVKTVERVNSDDRKAYLDSWSKHTLGTGVTTVTGLERFNGLTVSVAVDGASHPDREVADGEIELQDTGTEVYVGLKYTGRVKMLEPEGGLQNGNSQGSRKAVNRTMVRVWETGPIQVNGVIVPSRSANMSMGEAPPLVSGDLFSQARTQWGDNAGITVESVLPAPMTVVMIIGTIDVSARD